MSRPIVTPASISVLAGSTIVTPARWWASWMRCCASAAHRARSTRSLTPSVSVGSVTTWAWTRRPVSPQQREDVGQVELALGVVRAQPLEGVEQVAAVEGEDAGVDLADRELLGRRVARRPWSPRRARRRRRRRARRARSRRGRRAPWWPWSPPRRRRRGRVASAAIASAVISGTSPLSTITDASGSIAADAARTASPVPSGCAWTAVPTPSGSAPFSAPRGPSTTTIRPAPASCAATIGHGSSVVRTAGAGPSAWSSACGSPRRRRGSRRWVQACAHRSIGPCRRGALGGRPNGRTLGFGPSNPGSSPGPPVARRGRSRRAPGPPPAEGPRTYVR